MDATTKRTYADANVYKLPNDAPEQDRLDVQHIVIRKSLGDRISIAPVEQPRRILEIGCGEGRCTSEFGSKYPSSKVLGVDLTPVPEKLASITSPNVQYIAGNIRSLAGTEQLPLASFDYIYSRLLVYGMPDWPGYVKTAAALAAPGAWVEMQDLSMEFSTRDGIWIPEWLEAVRKVAAEQSMDLNCGIHIADHMRDAGLTDVQVKVYHWPIGTWMAKTHPETEALGRHLGSDKIANMHFEFVRLMLDGHPGYTDAEVKRLQQQAFETWQPTEGTSFPYYVVFGRKPPL